VRGKSGNYELLCLLSIHTLYGARHQTVFTLGLFTSQTRRCLLGAGRVFRGVSGSPWAGSRLTPSQSRPHVLQDPVPEHRDSGADAGQVGLGAPDAPADNARQEPAVVLFRMDHQGTPGIALDM